MANINNIDDNIKLQIINILLNDPSIRNKVNNILDNSNIETDDNGNSIIVNKLNNNNIKIKILSSDEYKKYIDNGTLDGSITARNENVWHFINGQDIIMFWQRHEQDHYTDLEILNYVKEFAQNYYSFNNIKTYKVIRIQTAQPNGVANFGNIYYSIKQDNITNITSLIPDKQILYFFACGWTMIQDMKTWAQDSKSSRERYAYFYNEFYKNIAKNSDHIYDSRTGCWRGSGYGRTANINFVTCFRPVFSYQDNNKSNNIFY